MSPGRLLHNLLASCTLAVSFAARASAVDVDPEVLAAEAARVKVMAEARSKTVAIFPPEGNGGGSGVLISADGYALSNFHVVHGSEKHMKCGLSDGRSYDAVVVGIDPVGDVALIKLFGRTDFPFAELADSDQVRVGDWVFASGNPFLLAHDFKPTVSFGIVSGVHRYQYPAGTLLEYADCIQTDAAINPGNSGGPLYNLEGKVVGINGRGSFEKRGRVNVGVGYAISINQIKHFLGCLKSGRIVDHATLGARVAGDEDGRVIVADVLDDSDAWRRGLRIGDEIVQFGGRQVRTVNAFKNVLGILPIGFRVPMSYRTKGVTHHTFVRLQGVHNPEELIAKTSGKPEPEKGLPPRRPGNPDEPKAPQPDKMPEGKPAPDGGPEKPKFRSPFGPADDAEKETPTPEVVKKSFEEKRGFANFHFNKVERDRVWKAASARFGSAPAAGPWTIEGEQAAGGAAAAKTAATISIDDARVEYTLPTGTARLPLSDSLAGFTDPEGSGGFLAALSLWRRLIAVGPEKFGNMQYEGAFPLPGLPGNYDVLLGRSGGVVCRFFFDPQLGDLVSLEASVDPELDPCELFFSDIRENGGRWLPRRIEVRYGDQIYTVVAPTKWQLEEAAK